MAIYPNFEVRQVKDNHASMEAGKTIYKDEHWVTIRVDEKTKLEMTVEDWKAGLEAKVSNKRLDPAEMDKFLKMYESFRDGSEIALDGTDIRSWPQITPAQVSTFIKIGIRTIEDLLAADENTIKAAGSGARELQRKAKAYLDAAKDGKASEKIVALENTVNELAEQNKQLMEALKAQLDKQEKQKKPPPNNKAA